jgi:hypothetical protein
MSKLLCLCGYVIVDQTDSLPYKAYFITDEDEESFSQSTVDTIEKFVIAWKQGTLSELFGDKFVEVHLKEGEVGDYINDVIAGSYVEHSRIIYECKQCGRIWLQSRNKDEQFFPYFPEKEERGILSSIRRDRENKKN